MAKSKQQKQEEALARKRQLYNSKLEEMKRWQPHGQSYKKWFERHGKQSAEKRLAEANANWGRYLLEAQLDIYGNPKRPPITRNKLETPAKFIAKGVIVQEDQYGVRACLTDSESFKV